ncbi:MAG: hypothetical protein ACRC3B_02420 [Bacteroidia bacterium]
MHIPESLVRLVMNSATWSVLVPVFAILFWWIKSPVKLYEQKIIAAYILLAVATEIIAKAVGRIFLNNLPVLHVYTLLQFLIVAWLYKPIMNGKIMSKIWLVLTVAFLAGSIINSLFIQSVWKFNGYARASESLIIVLFVLWYFRKLLFSEDAIKPLQDIPMFWISTGMLFYFSACFFVFLLSGDVYIINSKVFAISWAFHDLILIIHYIFITAALWPTRQPTPSMSPFSQAR